MKKLGAILICILLIAALTVPALAAETTTFTVTPSKTRAAIGEQITFTVSVSGTSECNALGYIPVFDTNCFKLVAGGKVLMNADANFDNAEDYIAGNTVLVSDYDMTTGGSAVCFTNALVPSGNVGTFVLEVISEEKTTSSVTVEAVAYYSDENGTTELTTALVPAAMTLNGTVEIVYGDINGDDEPDTKDANLIISYFFGNIELSDEQLAAADVNGDGEVDTKDANLIISYFFGNIEDFPVNS